MHRPTTPAAPPPGATTSPTRTTPPRRRTDRGAADPPRAQGRARLLGESELADARQGVLQAPGARDPLVAQLEEVDLVDVLEAAPVGGWPRQGPGAWPSTGTGRPRRPPRPRAGRPPCARPGGLPERGDPAGRGARRRRAVELIERGQVAAVEDLVDQAPDQRLGVIGGHGRRVDAEVGFRSSDEPG
jgi:hypothetical protein